MPRVEFEDMVGKVFTEVTQGQRQEGHDDIIFVVDDDEKYRMYHWQDCCENVYIEDIAGNLDDLVLSPILGAYKETNAGDSTEWGNTSTWTFYRIHTLKGAVSVRWYGTSNGYYSEDVYFERL